MHGFDPNFHFVGMTFNPELFVDMKDKYFLLNGRSYPDTVAAGPQATASSDGMLHYSQPMPAIINIPAGGKASCVWSTCPSRNITRCSLLGFR